MKVLVLLVHLSLLALGAAQLKARAWKSNSEFPSDKDYPEVALLKSKPNTGIAFSGGGSRAYTAAMGILAGIRDLDLLKNVRYMGGISGGSWATTTFTYAQNITDDEVFLGKVVNPEDITESGLKKMDPACARALTRPELTLICLEALKDKKVDSVAAAWAYAVSKTYLEPVGIKPGLRFSWDAETVSDIKKRNPSLANEEFTIPVNKNRPFPILGTSLVGPIEGAPFTSKTQNYSMIEITPLYVGQMNNLDIDFKYKGVGKVHTKHVGGAIEPFAFARTGGAPPKTGIPKKLSTSVLDVTAPTTPLDLQFSAGTSSYAPGSLFESIGIPKAAAELSMQFEYWSPDVEVRPQQDTMMFADGGVFQDVTLINFMQRRVKKIMTFFMTSTPLQPSTVWNVAAEPDKEGMITEDLSAFFGVIPPGEKRWENRSWELEMNQVFATEAFVPLVQSLQAAQQAGNGIYSTFNLTTVENKWWGIPAGLTFEVTFCYLGRLKTWESKLSSDMYKKLVPSKNADDLAQDMDSGEFKNFPNYITKGGGIDYEKANVLADLMGWSVHQNANLYRHMLS